MPLFTLLIVLIIIGAVLWITVAYVQPNVPGGLGWVVTLIVALICIFVLLSMVGVNTGIKLTSVFPVEQPDVIVLA